MSDYEEFDSFTENLIRKNRERDRFLDDSINYIDEDIENEVFELSTHETNEPIIDTKSVVKNDIKSNTNVVQKDNKYEDNAICGSPKRLYENLTKLSPNRQRVPLSKRLNSIAKTYQNSDEFTNESSYEKQDDDIQIKSSDSKSSISLSKSNSKSTLCPIESKESTQSDRLFQNLSNVSSNQQRVPLSQRLNTIAKSYNSEQTYDSPSVVTSNSNNIKQNPLSKNLSKTSLTKSLSKSNVFNIKTTTIESNENVSQTNLTQSVKNIVTKTDNIINVLQNNDFIKKSEVKKDEPKNIVVKTLRKKFLEERLFCSETSTAIAYKKELENRQKELTSLKRPMSPSLWQSKDTPTKNQSSHPCSSIVEKSEPVVEQVVPQVSTQNAIQSVQMDLDLPIEETKQNNLSTDSVDNETAHQTVCEAFQDIDEHSDEDINYDTHSETSEYKYINDKNLDIDYESPTKRNRLYPQLDINSQEVCGQYNASETNYGSPPPTKPPRTHEDIPDKDATPLRTISFYRREQSLKCKTNTTPTIQTIVFKDVVYEPQNNLDVYERKKRIQKKIEELKREVEEQNRIAGQASQALNLCLENTEFKGSIEQVEAEKVLLVSGQKRIALLNEIQKLKIKLTDTSFDTDMTTGSLNLSNIRLPVKGEYLVSRAKGIVADIHHLVCLVYNGPHVFVSNLLSTDKGIKNGVFEFEFGVSLSDLNNDFGVVVHIYDLITSKHQLPHEVKYHIKTLKRTPKKNKGSMKSPTVRSPGGPNAVLSTSFQLIGVLNINLFNYHKNSYKLENFNFNSPLEGTIQVRAELTIKHNYYREGFFDVRDTSGFWNLRWVVIRGSHLAFWRFPEDVTNKPALGNINLKDCINPIVQIIKGQILMRPNTIALITASNTPNTIFTKGGSIPRSRPIKYLMSGQNKDNTIEWAAYISRALNGIRQWSSDAVKPYTHEEFDRLLIQLD
ncbi:anillin-like isoform X2 [Oppia nitens]|uniref:anillin-like isoform X2 n=1 Tax=Oppia nitens TaxID=1686743 RepID=UPI0023DCB60A|nr:anillin-like isoform X2 [Oppia nitens]